MDLTRGTEFAGGKGKLGPAKAIVCHRCCYLSYPVVEFLLCLKGMCDHPGRVHDDDHHKHHVYDNLLSEIHQA